VRFQDDVSRPTTAAYAAVADKLQTALHYDLIQDEGATTASAVTYLLPIVAVILGAVVLGEPITWNLFAGFAIVLAGGGSEYPAGALPMRSGSLPLSRLVHLPLPERPDGHLR